jgi:hypothetical protein
LVSGNRDDDDDDNDNGGINVIETLSIQGPAITMKSRLKS